MVFKYLWMWSITDLAKVTVYASFESINHRISLTLIKAAITQTRNLEKRTKIWYFRKPHVYKNIVIYPLCSRNNLLFFCAWTRLKVQNLSLLSEGKLAILLQYCITKYNTEYKLIATHSETLSRVHRQQVEKAHNRGFLCILYYFHLKYKVHSTNIHITHLNHSNLSPLFTQICRIFFAWTRLQTVILNILSSLFENSVL